VHKEGIQRRGLGLLRLQPYRQVYVAWQRNLELSPRFYGPFLVLSRQGAMTYNLELPLGSLIHPVFHVSQLKLKLRRAVTPLIHLPPMNLVGVVQAESEEILDRSSKRVHNRAIVELLVRWQG
jgi:hypothetical protein